MKAQVLSDPKYIEEEPLSFQDIPVPEPGEFQVRMRVHCCGVCLTDKHVCEGELQPKCTQVVPGHQVVGRIDALGKGAARFQVGDRVGAVWLGWTCGECQFCKRGQENLCEKARFTGWDFDGGYAEYVVVDEAFIHKLPDTMDDLHTAPLLCAGLIGYRSLMQSGAGKGMRLGLYGYGNSAHITAQIANHMGCEVYAFARSNHHRELSVSLGAKWSGDISDIPPEKMDASIIFAPAGEVVTKALKDLERGGKIAINAIHMSDIPPIIYEDLFYERTIQSVSNGTRKDAEGLFSILKECPIQTEIETFSLAQANEALLLQKHSKIKAAAVLKVAES